MTRLASVLLVTSALALASCAARSGSDAGAASTAAAPAQAPAAQQQAPAAQSAPAAQQAPPKSVPPPPGSKLAKVQLEMNPGQVTEIMGQPTSQNTYQTGKAFIPYYYGSDTHRTEWNYKGVGRVIFGTNRWSGKQKVIRIDYDPAEDGY
jgi:hypothetical protein